MNLSLFDTPESRFRIEESVASVALGLEEFPFKGDEPVTVTCNCHRDGDVAIVECAMSVTLTQSCARCLKEMTSEVATSFTLVVRRMHTGEHQPEGPEEDDLLERDEDIRIIPRDEHTVDITDIVHDAVLLAVPTKLLCSEDCRGICPECGANRNETDCGCTVERTDPRWGNLEGLLGGDG